MVGRRIIYRNKIRLSLHNFYRIYTQLLKIELYFGQYLIFAMALNLLNPKLTLSLFIYFLLIFLPTNTQQIAIDYQESTIVQLNYSFYVGQLRFKGIISPYSIGYRNLGEGWVTSGNYLYIPVSFVKQYTTSHRIMVSITDKTGNSEDFSVYVVSTTRRLYFSERVDFNLKFQIPEFESHIISTSNPALSQQIQKTPPEATISNNNKKTEKVTKEFSFQLKERNINEKNDNQKYNIQGKKVAQQAVQGIITRPRFDQGPISQRQKLTSYEYVEEPAKTPLSEIIVDKDLPIQQKIKEILLLVEEEFDAIPKTIDTETNLIAAKPIDSIFMDLPEILELTDLLNTPNPALYLSKSIQQVVSSETLRCEEKISYLLETFGITHAHIEIVDSQFNRVYLTNKIGRESIESISKQLKEVEKKYSLERERYFSFQHSLSEGLQQLSKLYQLYNQEALRSQLSPGTSRFNYTFARQQEFQLQDHVLSEEALMKRIQNEKKIVQGQLKKARQEYEKKQLMARQIQQKYLVQQEKLKQARLKLKFIQQETQYRVRGSKQYLDQLKLSYLKKQVEITRYRSNIESSDLKQQTLQSNLKRLKEQLSISEGRIKEKQEIQLKNTLQNLRIALPNIQIEVNRIYYQCYRAGDIELREDLTRNQSFIYVMKIPNWFGYMRNIYGINEESLAESLYQRQNSSFWKPNPQNIEQIAIYPHNIFSTVWTKSLGMIDPSDLQKIFQIDFTCLKPSTLETGSGILKFIWKNILIVQDKEDRDKLYQLRLGSCSRIETVHQVIPQHGMYIFWRGNLGKSGYDVYLATIF